MPRIRFAGGHAIALEMEGLMRGESIWNAIGALVVILPLLYFAFRSPWLVAVGAVPSALSVLIVMAAYALAGHPAVGGGGRRRRPCSSGSASTASCCCSSPTATSAASSPTTARDGSRPARRSSMLLGMWTTAATFYGLAVVDFPSLEELGLLIGHSMMVCGVLTLVLVPALLPATPPARAGRSPPAGCRGSSSAGAALILGAAAVITVAAAHRGAAPAHRSVARSAARRRRRPRRSRPR